MAEAEKMDKGDKDDTSEQIAGYLAENFSSLLRMQKRLKTLKEFGPVQYTEDMAVADLASISESIRDAGEWLCAEDAEKDEPGVSGTL